MSTDKASFSDLTERAILALWLHGLLSPHDELCAVFRDYALLNARRALFKTNRAKTNSEKAMVIVINAIIDNLVGHTRSAQDGFAQAIELAGDTFVNHLRLLLEPSS